jgi:hypothetical protein
MNIHEKEYDLDCRNFGKICYQTNQCKNFAVEYEILKITPNYF